MLKALSPDTLEAVNGAQNYTLRMLALLGTHSQHDWQAIGLFCYRLRQHRRKMAIALAQMQSTRNRRSFTTLKAAWRGQGNRVCRHGVFFTKDQTQGCPCLLKSFPDSAWHNAKYMPHLDEQLQTITVTKFESARFLRLGILQAELRRRLW